MTNKGLIKEAARRLAKKFSLERIILFGSHARGTADRHSDVDLLVICKFKEGRRKMAFEMDMALWGLGLAKDIVILTPEEFERDKHIPGTVARPAWKEGKVLYAHKGTRH